MRPIYLIVIVLCLAMIAGYIALCTIATQGEGGIVPPLESSSTISRD